MSEGAGDEGWKNATKLSQHAFTQQGFRRVDYFSTKNGAEAKRLAPSRERDRTGEEDN
jgi:hypothetical protein